MKIRAVLGLLAVGLSAKPTFGKMHYSLGRLNPFSQQDVQGVGMTYILEEEALSGNVYHAGFVANSEAELQSSSFSVHLENRRLAEVTVLYRVLNGPANSELTLKLTFTNANGDTFEIEVDVSTDDDGQGDSAEFQIDSSYLESGATFAREVLSCSAVACTNTGTVVGDPHMVGLLGQKIDWAGVDSAWYCLLSDGPAFHVNVRLSAPMPEEFPDRQLISAVSVLTDDGRSSLVIEVKNPYSTNTDGCPKDSSVPCLADGGLRVLIDGEEAAAMQAPNENLRLPGSYPVVLSTANLPAECRPFGGDRIWATQFYGMATDQRHLRSTSVSFAQWILQPDTLAAPTWCAKFLEEGGSAGILSTRSEHATLRVDTPVAAVRINVGVNYQDLETAPDGTVLVPELEFWQTDLGFDDLQLSDDVAGLMGDTSRFVFDDEGVPVTSGLGALHGTVESYRVAGPFARDFENMHQ